MSTPQRSSGLLLWAVALFVAGGLVWAAAITMTVLDLSWSDRLPNTIVITDAAIAMTMTMCAVTFLLVDRQRRYLLGAWDELKQELLAAIAKARQEASRDIEAARRDLKHDTGSIPIVTDKMLEMPTIGDALHAVALVSSELHQVVDRLGDIDRRLGEPEQLPDNVHEIAREAYRTGRRMRESEEN